MAGLRWVGYEEALELVLEGIKMGSPGFRAKGGRQKTAAKSSPVKKNPPRARAKTASPSRAKAPAKRKTAPGGGTPGQSLARPKKIVKK